MLFSILKTNVSKTILIADITFTTFEYLFDAFSFSTDGGPKNVTMNLVPPNSRSVFYLCGDEVFPNVFSNPIQVGYKQLPTNPLHVQGVPHLSSWCLRSFHGLADFPRNVTNFSVQLRDRNVDNNPNDSMKPSNHFFLVLCKYCRIFLMFYQTKIAHTSVGSYDYILILSREQKESELRVEKMRFFYPSEVVI